MKKATKPGRKGNSGRKPALDKKIQLSIYPPGSWIYSIGLDRSKELCLNVLEKEAKKIDKK